LFCQPFPGLLQPVRTTIHIEDIGFVSQPVDHGCRHHRIGKDFIPSLEREVGGNDGGFSASPKGEMGKE